MNCRLEPSNGGMFVLEPGQAASRADNRGLACGAEGEGAAGRRGGPHPGASQGPHSFVGGGGMMATRVA